MQPLTKLFSCAIFKSALFRGVFSWWRVKPGKQWFSPP